LSIAPLASEILWNEAAGQDVFVERGGEEEDGGLERRKGEAEDKEGRVPFMKDS
jgi:hypothetical protein